MMALLVVYNCMSTTAQRRLLQELQKVRKSKEEGIEAAPNEDNLYQWEAVIYGPLNTIWEGATLRLQIEFDDEYPKQPPVVRFRSRMFHPNIYSDGKICIDSTPALSSPPEQVEPHDRHHVPPHLPPLPPRRPQP
jgi:ubiquitin-protein ligase